MMNAIRTRQNDSKTRIGHRLLAGAVGIAVGVGVLGAAIPSASATPTTVHGRAPTEPPRSSQALPPGVTLDPILAELVNVVKGYMEGALVNEVAAAMGIGGDHNAQQLANIQRDVNALRDEVAHGFAKQALATQVALTKPYTSSVDQYMDDLSGMVGHQAEMTKWRKIADDTTASDQQRKDAQQAFDYHKQQYTAYRAQFVKDYGTSPAHGAVRYFNSMLSPELGVDGLIGNIRKVIMTDRDIHTLTSEHTKTVSAVLAYFEVYQVQANLLNTMYDAFCDKDTGKQNANEMLKCLDKQLLLLPTPIPAGVGIPKSDGMKDTHDKLMWVVAGGHLTMDQRYAHDPARDDAWWAAKNTTDTKKAGFGDWRMPEDTELNDFTADARPTDNVATFLTMKGINTLDTFFDKAIWEYGARVDTYQVDGHHQTLTTHGATYLSVTDGVKRGVCWPLLDHSQAYSQSGIDQKFQQCRGTLLMVRSTGDVNYM